MPHQVAEECRKCWHVVVHGDKGDINTSSKITDLNIIIKAGSNLMLSDLGQIGRMQLDWRATHPSMNQPHPRQSSKKVTGDDSPFMSKLLPLAELLDGLTAFAGVGMHTHIYTHTHEQLHTHTHTHIYIYICMYMHMCNTHTHTYTHIYIYTHDYTRMYAYDIDVQFSQNICVCVSKKKTYFILGCFEVNGRILGSSPEFRCSMACTAAQVPVKTRQARWRTGLP